jgi:YesN/AraC family two-component response regulator
VIFMDLAMPGIDGWETIRRLRALGCTGAQMAIVSANAFDKGLDNAVGIPTEDFILKPVRHSELLDWLTQRLSLSWLEAPAAEPAAEPPAVLVYPPRKQLETLLEVVSLGYYRGIINLLDEMEEGETDVAPFVGKMRELARQFQFEAMGQHLNHAIHDPQ